MVSDATATLYQTLLKSSHLLKSTDVDNYVTYANSFLSGFKATTMFPNVNKCVTNLQKAANSWNVTVQNLMNPSKTSKNEDYVFNVTKTISNTSADAVSECFTTSISVYTYFLVQQSLFPGGSLDYFSAFLQNMIGNIITFNSIYQNIVTAQAANKTSDVYFYIGRLANLVISVKPIDYEPLEHSVLRLAQEGLDS